MALGWGIKLEDAGLALDDVVIRAEQMGDREVLDKVAKLCEQKSRDARAAKGRLNRDQRRKR